MLKNSYFHLLSLSNSALPRALNPSFFLSVLSYSQTKAGVMRGGSFVNLGFSVFPGMFPALSVAPLGSASVPAQAAGSPKG